MILGRLRRDIAITQPGIFLSQPGRVIKPSYHCAPIIVSIESAITSRDCNEKRIPLVPIEIPSLTPTVLKRIPTKPASTTPFLTSSARVSKCILHGLPSYHTLPIPIWALAISVSFKPVA